MGQSKLPLFMTPKKSPEKRYLEKEEEADENKENLDQSQPKLKKHKSGNIEQERPNTPIELDRDENENESENTVKNNSTASKVESGEISITSIDKDEDSNISTNPGNSQSKSKISKEEREEIKKEKDRLKEEKKLQREKEWEEKKLKKQAELEEKKLQREKELEERKLKKQLELEEKKLQREKELEDRKIKKEKLESEKKAKKEQREQEKLDRQRQKEEEKIKKKAEFEAKKKSQEEEKQNTIKVEQEKKQKQSITNFFKVAKATSDTSPVKPTDSKSTTPHPSPSKPGKSDYESYFLPFYLNPNTKLINNIPDKNEGDVLESFVERDTTNIPDFKSYLQSCKNPSTLSKYVSTHEVVQNMNMGNNVVAENLFKSLNLKYLKFYENKKIPYLGTYTAVTETQIRQLANNPFLKIESEKIDIEYDYDSDLDNESDEEGEGEDIDKDEDEDEDEETEDHSDVDEFVESDESGENNMKKRIIGTLIPVTKWIGQEIDTNDDEFGNYFNSLQYERLKPSIVYPIDPFHNYWVSGSTSQVEKKSLKTESAECNGYDNFKAPTSTSVSTNTMDISKPMIIKKKVITDPVDIKKLIDLIETNKGFTINTLTEVVQKQVLSKYAKSVVKNSIKDVAVFEKAKNEWVIKK